MLVRRRESKIHFAHRTFAWESEAKGKAHVHVVIIGFGAFDLRRSGSMSTRRSANRAPASRARKRADEVVATVTEAANISPYLVAGPDFVFAARGKPLCPVPEIVFGSMPNDGGHLLMSSFGRDMLLREQPEASQVPAPLRRGRGIPERDGAMVPLVGRRESGGVPQMPAVMDCVHAVAIHRRKSKRQTTKELANTPAYFAEIRQPDSKYLLIPSVSSERRRYIPIGFMRPDVIASNLVLLVPGAEPLSLRGTVFRHAHGLGAAGCRTAEVATTVTRTGSSTTITRGPPSRPRHNAAA